MEVLYKEERGSSFPAANKRLSLIFFSSCVELPSSENNETNASISLLRSLISKEEKIIILLLSYK